MDQINTMAAGISVGALVMFKESYDGLPADAKAILDRTGKNTGKLLTERIRAMDQAAFDRLKANKTVIDINDTEKMAWNAMFMKVRLALKAEGKIRGDVFDEVVAAAGP
jgi:TRAP-type C4-dicarboxylate transport system substrate-binding protein